jgi:hypothetical protein
VRPRPAPPRYVLPCPAEPRAAVRSIQIQIQICLNRPGARAARGGGEAQVSDAARRVWFLAAARGDFEFCVKARAPRPAPRAPRPAPRAPRRPPKPPGGAPRSSARARSGRAAPRAHARPGLRFTMEHFARMRGTLPRIPFARCCGGVRHARDGRGVSGWNGGRDSAWPVSTGEGTRRVRLVRGEGLGVYSGTRRRWRPSGASPTSRSCSWLGRARRASLRWRASGSRSCVQTTSARCLPRGATPAPAPSPLPAVPRTLTLDIINFREPFLINPSIQRLTC